MLLLFYYHRGCLGAIDGLVSCFCEELAEGVARGGLNGGLGDGGVVVSVVVCSVRMV